VFITSNCLLYFAAYVFAVDGSYPIIFVASGIFHSLSYILVVAELNLILVKPLQKQKASEPVLVTPRGMFITVKPPGHAIRMLPALL